MISEMCERFTKTAKLVKFTFFYRFKSFSFFPKKWPKNFWKKKVFNPHFCWSSRYSLLLYSLRHYVAITFFNVANHVLYSGGRLEKGGHIAVFCCDNKLFHFCKVCIPVWEVGKVAPKASVSNVEMLWQFLQVACSKLINWISVLKSWVVNSVVQVSEMAPNPGWFSQWAFPFITIVLKKSENHFLSIINILNKTTNIERTAQFNCGSFPVLSWKPLVHWAFQNNRPSSSFILIFFLTNQHWWGFFFFEFQKQIF